MNKFMNLPNTKSRPKKKLRELNINTPKACLHMPIIPGQMHNRNRVRLSPPLQIKATQDLAS